jgi:hypothetical protein
MKGVSVTSRPRTETADALFVAYFLPLYPPDARADLAAARRTDANPAGNPAITAHLDEAAEVFARQAPELLGTSAPLDFTDESVHRLSAALTAERRDGWATKGKPGTPESELFNVVVHGAAYVGACIVRAHGGVWSARRPLWESVVRLSSRAGEADLAVFHWWLKTLADADLARGVTLADRYRAHVENPTAKPEALPPIVSDVGRRLPRLTKPRYDTFYKWIKAHLPELRDVGEHFPSPERFEELAFSSLDFALVGGGRMLVVSGVNAHGLHLYWLTSAGFEKSAFYPCDSFPAPKVVAGANDPTIRVVVRSEGKEVVHEVLWWGP